MFSLRQAFNAVAAGVCGAGIVAALGRDRPEEAAIEALFAVANVLAAGYRSPS